MVETKNAVPTNTVLAESEIRSLLYRERYYKDSCQWDKLRSCYHPDPSKTLIDISWSDSLVPPCVILAQLLK